MEQKMRHNKVKESIPNDWEQKILGDIIMFQRGHDLPKNK